MDKIKEVTQKEVKDHIKFIKICHRFAIKYANEHCKDDASKITKIQELAISFLINMSTFYFNETATKQHYLDLIRIINNQIQASFTALLNERFPNRTILQ